MNYLALINYIVVMSATPGPNNLILSSAGVNFGLKRTLPMCLGVTIGNSLQCFLALATFHFLFKWIEELRFPLAIVGCAYLLWLSWRLYQTTQLTTQNQLDQPMGFWQMFFFQAINPKAWIMVINIAILFGTTDAQWTHHLLLAVINGCVNFPCVFIWAALGARLKVFLQQPLQLKRFNLCMALLMSGTAVWLLADEAILFWNSSFIATYFSS